MVCGKAIKPHKFTLNGASKKHFYEKIIINNQLLWAILYYFKCSNYCTQNGCIKEKVIKQKFKDKTELLGLLMGGSSSKGTTAERRLPVKVLINQY